MKNTLYPSFSCCRKQLFLLLAALIFFTPVFGQFLDPASHLKFAEPLPTPGVINARNGGNFNIGMYETNQYLGLRNGNTQLFTKVWGYGTSASTASYPGPTIRASRNEPVEVKWESQLPNNHFLPVDYSIHMAKPTLGVPVVAHLHGGHTESASDGLPEAWFTKGFAEKGPHWVKQKYYYQNDQEAATLWYHDHALGITRLNVYAGLAGFYLLTDPTEQNLINQNVLPSGNYEREIVIQDRMFTTDGQLYFPSNASEFYDEIPPLAPTPTVLPEFFGNFILVNGMVWPQMRVEPRKYRLRLLNGSDSRFYIFKLENGADFLQIATDDGLLPHPVPVNELLLAPGERIDVVVDFTGEAGNSFKLLNVGPDEPFKGFNPNGTMSDGMGGALPAADPATTGQIVQFIVNLPMSGMPNATVGTGSTLRPNIQPLVQSGANRQVVLFEGTDQLGRLKPILGTLADGPLDWFAPITENPMLNDVEIWDIYNATEDAHPIHLHLVSFQILGRTDFGGQIGLDGKLQLNSPVNFNNLTPPPANEKGWKDTAVSPPGQVTRVIAKFDRVGRYVWHCHILSHEDHEMMRPYEVRPFEVNITTPDVPFGCQGLGVLKANVLNANALAMPLSYNWSNGLGNGASVIFTANGTYTVTVTDGAGNISIASVTTNVNPYTTLSSYTMLSGKDLELKKSTANGGVGVMDSGKKAKIKNNSVVNGFVRAAQIDLDNSSTINGDASYGAASVTLPVFRINTMSNNSSPKLTVDKNQTVTISSQNYVFDKIEVKEGGTLKVNAGISILYANEIKTKDGASIRFYGNTEVRVEKKADLGKDNFVGPSGENTVTFWVEKDVKVDEGSTFTANVYSLGKIESKGKSNASNLMTGIFISEGDFKSEYATWNANPNCGLELNGGQYLLAPENDLLGLSASQNEHQVNLLWVTNTEYKNDYFVVERSADGVHFEPVTDVQRMYSGHKPNQYRSLDTRPNTGPNFYRIKEFFTDGTFMYSEIQQVDFQMVLGELNLWPNPTSSTVNLYNELYAGKSAKVVISNNLGQPILLQEFEALPDAPVSFEMDSFRDGLYWLTIRVDGFREVTRRFVLTR